MPEIFDSEDLKKDQAQDQSQSPSQAAAGEISVESKEISEEKPASPGVIPPEKPANKSKKHRHRHVDEYSEVMRNEKPHDQPFSAYVPKPKKLKFSTQNQDERIILMLRQHPVTQLKWILLAVGLVFLPQLFMTAGIFDFLPGRFYLGGLIGWYLVVTGFILEALLKWYYNVYIITDERIVDIDFHSLLNRNISSAKIDNIEDVTASTAGLLSTLFDYGNVEIQTAAEKREFEFPGVPHPGRVSTLLNELILEEEREKLEGRVS